MSKFNLFILLLLAFSMLSCNKDKNENPVLNDAGYNIGRGVFVLNEGTFTYANSSLSFYDNEADTVCNNLFFKVNNAPIGDVGQSLKLHGGDLFIVVNNSKYIYKADAKTMKYKGKVEGMTSPRQMCVLEDGKAYVTDLASPGLWLVDLNTMENKGLIETGKSTEAVVRVGDEVFVSNWSNYYVGSVSNNTVQVIDVKGDRLVGEIEVATEPNAMVVDKDNNIIAGNKSTRAAKNSGIRNARVVDSDGSRLVVVKRTDISLDSRKGREMALADNTTSLFNLSWDKGMMDRAQAEYEGLDFERWGVNMSEEIAEVKSKGELDINLFEERMTLAFKLTEEEYNRAVTSLMRIDTDLSKALLKMTEYE